MLCRGALGPHFGGLGRQLAHDLDPELSQGRQNKLNCTPVQAGAPISEAPGIEVTAKEGGDLVLLGLTVNLNTD